ncbi:hypothetical protein EDD93_3694 [Streptomyces sp. 840.1]|uniref:hypothetical protein n=1 Tax=Streptomyces sp. 840.1 TaxID=2485152 RepID=UPI000F470A6A|nr:hypothetical protein [Streptomyces sp. 840.1]ROQ69197.1 hypothetical protein EDD93_3694 [Streptomyces sp. 840.1]
MTAAADLRTIATTWADLNDALGAPTVIAGFGRGLRGYLAAIEDTDPTTAAELRALERDPAQLGQRPIPIRLQVYATMRTVEAALLGCAAAVAEHVQRPPISMPAPRRAAIARTRADRVAWADHARRVQAAQDDAADRRRWRWTGTQPTAPYAALWLLGRVTCAPGPFRPLAPAQQQHITHVAAEGRRRIEQILDTGSETATLTTPCPDCGGTITVHGGAGASPLANCRGCGGVWSELGAAA